jgi:hypothetical protein
MITSMSKLRPRTAAAKQRATVRKLSFDIRSIPKKAPAPSARRRLRFYTHGK